MCCAWMLPKHIPQAEVENNKEATAREEAEQIARWTATVQRVLDLRCDGVVDEAVWSEVGGRSGGGRCKLQYKGPWVFYA